MKRILQISCWLLAAMVVQSKLLCEMKCFFGSVCWPTDKEISDFVSSLQGSAVFPSEHKYADLNTMKNDRVKKDPSIIVFVKSAADIKQCVRFAKSYNIPVAIMSSGHSYVGRSTRDGCLLIQMSNMTAIQIRTDLTERNAAGEITLQTGSPWARVYKEVDKHNRLVVGGSAHTVAIGGYTQGGGHSPMSRSLGLAVDSLLEVQLITADGQLVTANAKETYNHDTGKTSGPDLFWALRGGGGGTWGVVVTFTFKLHFPPSGFVRYLAYYVVPINQTSAAVDGLSSVIEKLKSLPRQWNGYVLTSSTPPPNEPSLMGSMTVFLLHFGDMNSPSLSAINPLKNDGMNVYNDLKNFSTFWEYEQTALDADVSALRTYVVNTLVQYDVDARQLANVVVDETFSYRTPTSGVGCTFAFIGGGKTMDVDMADTPINPALRSALFSLTCGTTWYYTSNDLMHLTNSNRFNTKLQQFGKGVYFNEPAANLTNWKKEYWGHEGNYEKLLSIKKKWDRSNFFCCHDCVGSDRTDGSGWMWTSSGSKLASMSFIFTLMISAALLF